MYYDFVSDYFRPAVVVDYFREAFVLDYNRIRITLDTELRRSRETHGFGSPDLTSVPVLKKDSVILEIKYNRFFPRWMSQLIQMSRFERTAISKYCLARMI